MSIDIKSTQANMTTREGLGILFLLVFVCLLFLPRVICATWSFSDDGTWLEALQDVQAGIQKGDLAVVMTLKDELVSVGNAMMGSEDIMKSEKGLAFKNWKVFMKPDLYPKFVKKKEEAVSENP